MAENNSSAPLKTAEGAAKPVPGTFMTVDQACEWGWGDVRKEVGTQGWTTGDSCNFYGFYLWGWNYRGQYELQRTATRSAVMQEIQSAAPTAPQPQVEPAGAPAELPDSVIDATAEAIGEAYDCGRVWSAWHVGTMGPSDFYSVAEDGDRVAEIARAAITAYLATTQPAATVTQQLTADQQTGDIKSDEDCILVPRGLLGAACSALARHDESPKTLHELRRYTVGDLSKAQPAPVGEYPALPEPATWLVVRGAFRASPDGQDAESNEWLEEAHEPREKGSFAVYTEQQLKGFADATHAMRAGEQEPVATVTSWTNGSYHRNYKLEWHKDVPEGTKLYTRATQGDAQ